MTVELVIRYVKVLIAFVLLWVGIWVYNNYGCRKVEGNEMAPALAGDSYKLIRPKVRTADQLQHDDIVAYSYSVPGAKGLRNPAARVIGLPGDRIRIEKGEVYRNGNKISSAYVQQRTSEDYAEVVVPRDSVFLLCDNRRAGVGFDSRAIGPVGQWAIAGRFK